MKIGVEMVITKYLLNYLSDKKNLLTFFVANLILYNFGPVSFCRRIINKKVISENVQKFEKKIYIFRYNFFFIILRKNDIRPFL